MTEQFVLPPETLEGLKQGQQKLKLAKEIIAKAKIAGLDMSRQEAEVRENERRTLKFRDAFFPGESLD